MPQMNDLSQPAYTPDDVYLAIAHGLIGFALRSDDITETARALVYRDADTMYLHRQITSPEPVTSTAPRLWSLEAGAKFIFEEETYEVALLGKESAQLKCGSK